MGMRASFKKMNLLAANKKVIKRRSPTPKKVRSIVEMVSSSTKFEVSKFGGIGNFELWRSRVKNLLAYQDILKTLRAVKPANLEEADWKELKKQETMNVVQADDSYYSEGDVLQLPAYMALFEQAKGEGSRREYGCVDENSTAMRRARELQANLSPQFPSVVVKFLLHSHTTRGLPKDFCTSHLPNHDTAIILVDENGRETESKYLIEKHGLSGGWRGFPLQHNLVPGDVVVFQLIQPLKLKLYVVRINDSANIAGAISLLDLSHYAQPIATEGLLLEGYDVEENVLRIEDAADQLTRIQHESDNLEREVSTSDNLLSGSDRDNNPLQPMNVVEFSQVKNFEDFNVVVNNLNIDSEISEDTRLKYYELCRSRNAYLHELEEPGLNYTLIAGAITETVKIADGIKAATLATGRDVLEVWDRTLIGVGHFSMEVGFLRGRINELIRLCEGAEIVAGKEKEKAIAEAKMKDLLYKVSKVSGVIKILEEEIQAHSGGERVEEVFKNVASADW
ncbi:PREDICTED: B3 domain-containing protein Os01g0234100-like [Ipomoea nil]|uniref:B3 domain-containing protein Os01g0234100-like n=1 Tax=Ipomoea nil TaxID=35883 RepID=UPI00090140A5|nr:PREDICTED: B3 domain-containing protein Os01g0234100-like [Ipomoea nil]